MKKKLKFINLPLYIYPQFMFMGNFGYDVYSTLNVIGIANSFIIILLLCY